MRVRERARERVTNVIALVRLAGPGLVVKGGPEVRFSWTRAQHTCSVSANHAGERNF